VPIIEDQRRREKGDSKLGELTAESWGAGQRENAGDAAR
jgi:hypothetical protein